MNSIFSNPSYSFDYKKKNLIMFRCSECNNIPKINLIYNKENNIEVKIRCKNNHIKTKNLENFLNDKYYNIENVLCAFCDKYNSNYYCYNCKCFICNNCVIHYKHDSSHKIIDKYKFDCTCIEHNKKYIAYCKSCEKNLCDICLNNHSTCVIYYYEKCSFDSNKVKIQLNNNKRIIEKVLNIKKTIEETLYNYLNQLKTNFEKFNKYIELENEFINNLIYIFDCNQSQLNYEIIYNCEKNIICEPNNLQELLNKIENIQYSNIKDKINQLNYFFLNASNLNKEKIIKNSYLPYCNKNKNFNNTYTNNPNNTPKYSLTNNFSNLHSNKYNNDDEYPKDILKVQTINDNDKFPKKQSKIETISGDNKFQNYKSQNKEKIITKKLNNINLNQGFINNEFIKNNYYTVNVFSQDLNYFSEDEKSKNIRDELSSNNIYEYEIEEKDAVNCIIELKNHYITAGLKNGIINIYSNFYFKKCISINEHQKGIVSIIELKSGKILSGSLDNFMKIFIIDYKENIYQLYESYNYHYEPINFIIELSSRNIISTSDSKFILWIKNDKIPYTKEKSGNNVRKIIELKNKRIIMNHDNYFTFWKYENSQLYLEILHNFQFNSILLKEIKENIYIIGNKEELIIMDGNIGFKKIKIIKNFYNISNCLSINNKTLLLCNENNIYKLNIENLKEIKKEKEFLKIHQNQINDIIKLSDNLIVTCGDDQKIKIFSNNKFN